MKYSKQFVEEKKKKQTNKQTNTFETLASISVNQDKGGRNELRPKS